jgi:hypothetical protein
MSDMGKSTGTRVGPTLTDTILARKLAAFLRKHPELARWVTIKLNTEEGCRDLKRLLIVESIDRSLK